MIILHQWKTISDPKETAEVFNCFFSNVVKELNIEEIIDTEKQRSCESISDPILRAIKKYEDHPSILKIKQFSLDRPNFSFLHTDSISIVKEIVSLKVSTASPISNIPPKIMKENLDIFSVKLTKDFNDAVDKAEFPDNCKLADITPAHKDNSKMDKSNYRPVSILPHISKIFERMLYYQIDNFLDNII